MSASVLREFLIRFGFDVDSGKLDALEAGIERSHKALLAFGAAASATGAAITALVHETTEYASSAVDNASRLGTSAEEVQQLGFMAAETGTHFDSLVLAVKTMRVQLNAAREGSKEAQAVFGKLGIDPNAIGDAPAEMLAALADGLSRASSETERTALAQATMGRGASEIRPLLAEGRDGIAKMADEFARLNLGMSEGSARRFEAFGDRVDVLSASFRAWRHELAADFLPAFERATEDTITFISETRKGHGALGEFLHDIGGVAGVLQVAAAAAGSFVLAWQFPALVGGIKAAAAALYEFGFAGLFAMAGPLLGGAVVFALVLAADELLTYLRGGRTVLGELIVDFQSPKAGDGWIVKQARAALRLIAEIKRAIDKDLFPAWSTLWESDDEAKARMGRRAGIPTVTAAPPPDKWSGLSIGDKADALFGLLFANEIAKIAKVNTEPLIGLGIPGPWMQPSVAGGMPGVAPPVTQNNTINITATSASDAASGTRDALDGSHKRLANEVRRATPAGPVK